MSTYAAFRRTPVNPQQSLQVQTVTIPAPNRGIVMDENQTYMKPGGAITCDNWKPTLRGVSLRGGSERYVDLHAPTGAVWQHSHAYAVGNHAADTADTSVWNCAVAHTSAATTSFASERLAHPTYWTRVPALAITDPVREPIISAFEYVVAGSSRMFAAQPTKIWEVTNPAAPVLIKSGQTSGNHTAAQLSNQGGDWLLVVNDGGDPVIRFDGTTGEVLIPGYVPPAGFPNTIDVVDADYPDAAVADGQNLVHVCKYRNRLFFIEKDSMNAWYLPLNAVGGMLEQIPLSGAATKGGKLLFSAVWSLDAGDGTDDKIVFATTEGELLIFTGSDPDSATNWRQEGRYQMSPPMGQNAYLQIGGDLLIATREGILPTSAAITKARAELELAAVTRPIKPLWRNQVLTKRAFPWTMCKWDTFGGIFVTWPGGNPGKYVCGAVNAATVAWARFTGWDAVCFMRLDDRMFFGTQSGIVMEADVGGHDDGNPYTATLVGGWELFQSTSQTVAWLQARATYASRTTVNFNPQISSMVDYVYALPDKPPIAEDPGPRGFWDEGEWDESLWDSGLDELPVKNTMWVSVGTTGYSHAPVVQVTLLQTSKPELDLISVAATFARMGVNV